MGLMKGLIRSGGVWAVVAALAVAGCHRGAPAPGSTSGTGTAATPTVSPADLEPSVPAPASDLARCERNLRALQMAAQLYHEQTGASLDPERWPDQLEPFRKKVAQPGDDGTCPKAEKGSGYALNPAAASGGEGEDRVLFFESDALSGAPSDLSFRHDRSALLVTVSGKVLHVREAAAKASGPISGDLMSDGTVLGKTASATW